MRALVLAAVMAAGLAGQAVAQEGDIVATIRGQMDAFLAEDPARAFTYASPGIQGLFGTPDNFARMVRDGYPMVWRPDDVRFGPLRQVEGAQLQSVYVTDADGRAHLLEYRMEQIDGRWRIAGVRLLQAPEASV